MRCFMKRKLFAALLCVFLLPTALLSACGTEDTAPAVIEKKEQNQVLSRLKASLTVEIYNGVTKELQYQGWPTVCKGEGETLYAAASVRTEHIDIYGAVGFTKSLDGGKTWDSLRIVKDTPLDDRDAGIIYLGDGHLMVTWFTHDAYKYRDGGIYGGYRARSTAEQLAAVDARLDALTAEQAKEGSYVMHSYDDGATWGEPIAIPITAPHGATRSQDGSTLFYAGVKKGAAGASLKAGCVYVYQSTDQGLTWSLMSSISYPKSANGESINDVSEPYILQLQDGSFLVGLRYNPSGMGVFCSRSADGSEWTPFEQIDNLQGAPPHFLQLKSGVIVLTYSYRIGSKCGVRARLSYDNGVTWSHEIILEIADQKSNSDLGYPSTVELEDGTLMTAYYQAYKNDSYCSVLYTKWKLEPAEA